MKIHTIVPAMLGTAQIALAQGTFIFDQQSSDENRIYHGGSILLSDHPIQSFTPTLSSVGFIRLYFEAPDFLYATAVNLRSDSPTGQIIGTTQPQNPSSTGPFTFIFSSPVSVTPGTTYYFEPITQLGNSWLNGSQIYNYPGGEIVGSLGGTYDLWFREGIIVPEPGVISLLVVGAASFLCKRRYL